MARKPTTQLPPAAHAALLIAEADAALAARTLERDAARLDALRLRHAAQVAAADAELADARRKAQAASRARADLAAKLGKDYAVDWDAVALEPHTGALVPLHPKD